MEKVLFILFITGATFGVGYMQGGSNVQSKWDAENHARAVLANAVKHQQETATVQVVTEYVDRIKIVREQGRTITEKVTEYVPVNNCSVDAGFISLHDSAATGSATEATRAANDEAVTVKDALAVVTENYASCRLNAIQLEALQDWAAKVSNPKE
jgi:nucleotidyltransferase/DNA polymerase involved in DNA repair